MLWQISSFPKCKYHVFLSHSQEDKDALVHPVYNLLNQSGVLPFLDAEDYYYGQDSRTALRNGILDSRHVVFFITDAMLKSSRGWCLLELAFAELIELNFQMRGGKLLNQFLPLFFLEQTDERLQRSVWQFLRDRGKFFNPATDGDRTVWSTNEIRAFLLREQHLATNTARSARTDKVLASQLQKSSGLFDRVTRFHPAKIPPQ